MADDLIDLVSARIRTAVETKNALLDLAGPIAAAGQILADALRAGGSVLFCGNGGSAADALHLAGELSGRFLQDREPLRAAALTGNVAGLTAIANDYSFEEVFAREVRAQGRRGDILVGLSTSGNSKNVLRAMETASEMGLVRIGMTGASGGRLGEPGAFVEHCLRAPSTEVPRIQECHLLIGHILCEIAESSLFPE